MQNTMKPDSGSSRRHDDEEKQSQNSLKKPEELIMEQEEIDKDMALIRRQLLEIQQKKNKIYSLQADLRVMVKLQEKISQKITQPILPQQKELKSQFYDEDQSAQQKRPQQ